MSFDFAAYIADVEALMGGAAPSEPSPAAVAVLEPSPPVVVAVEPEVVPRPAVAVELSAPDIEPPPSIAEPVSENLRDWLEGVGVPTAVPDMESMPVTRVSAHGVAMAQRFESIWLEKDLVFFPRITVRGGRKSLALNWDDMNLSEDMKLALKRAEVSSVSVTTNQRLKSATGRLEVMRTKFYYQLLQVGGEWCTTTDKYAACCLRLAEMMETQKVLADSIAESYDDNKRQVGMKLMDVFRSAGMPEAEALQRLGRVLSLYPTLDQMLDGFRLEIEPPRFVPSLSRRGELSAQMLEAQVAEAAARNSLQEQLAVDRVRRAGERTMAESYAKAIGNFELRLQSRIREVVSTLTANSVKPGRLPDRTRNALQSGLEDLRAMVDTDWGAAMMAGGSNVTMAGMVEQIEAFARRVEQSESTDMTQVRGTLDDLLGQLIPVEEFTIGEEDGGGQNMRRINFRAA